MLVLLLPAMDLNQPPRGKHHHVPRQGSARTTSTIAWLQWGRHVPSQGETQGWGRMRWWNHLSWSVGTQTITSLHIGGKKTHALKFPSEKLLKMKNAVTPPVKPILQIWDVSFLGETELVKSHMCGLLMAHPSLGASRGCLGWPSSPSPHEAH